METQFYILEIDSTFGGRLTTRIFSSVELAKSFAAKWANRRHNHIIDEWDEWDDEDDLPYYDYQFGEESYQFAICQRTLDEDFEIACRYLKLASPTPSIESKSYNPEANGWTVTSISAEDLAYVANMLKKTD